MASPVNQHCASCIGTLSFPVRQIRTACHGKTMLRPADARSQVHVTSAVPAAAVRILERDGELGTWE